MSKKIHQDIYVGMVIILSSIFLWMKTLSFSGGGAAFPRALLILFAFFGVLIALAGFKKTKQLRENEEVTYDGDEEALNASILKSPIAGILLFVIYGIFIKYIGFFPSTILFLPAFLWFMGAKSWKQYVYVTVGMTLFIYLFFVLQLNVPLPVGILFQ